MSKPRIGVIGGSGLYSLGNGVHTEWKEVDTPFGAPSNFYLAAEFEACDLFFLPRHGAGHTILPSELNHRANIFGFKQLGVSHIISITAVGSLKEAIAPGDLVLPDQFFDRSRRSAEFTFFGDGIVAHVPFGEPVSPALRAYLKGKADELSSEGELTVHDGGTYVNMEGPAFSTRAESGFYRSLGFEVIGMTSLGEARLAREAEIAYAPIAVVTDFDCWHKSEEPVTAKLVSDNARIPLAFVTRLIDAITMDGLAGVPNDAEGALQGSIMTSETAIPAETRKRLLPIIGNYLELEE